MTESEHILWLQRILENENRKLYVAEMDGNPVGTVRLDKDPTGYEISWTVSPTSRNSGVGKAMVNLAAREIIEPIRAEIKIGNKASMRIAEAAGMIFEREDDGISHYRRSAMSDVYP